MTAAKAKQVVITSNIKDRLALTDLNVLQGNLKDLPDDSYKKLRRSILIHGFFAPLFVWESKIENKIYLLDGTQRYVTLNLMKNDGYKIPQLPVVFIEAENVDDAKAKLAAIASQFGKFNKAGVDEFFASFKFDADLFETIEIPVFEMPVTVNVDGYEREKAGFTETEFPDLENKDTPEFAQITFIVHKTQKEYIDYAIRLAKTAAKKDTPNENSNGNALSEIAEFYLEHHGQR